MQYLISFLEGIVTFISPCLLPMLPIYISYFAGGGERSTTKTLRCALGFVLGFAGSSLNMMVLIYSYQASFNQLMNTDFVAVEVVRGVAGSLGIILTVPCVAVITAWLLSRKKKA